MKFGKVYFYLNWVVVAVACGKNFKNNKAYENHIQSKKHQEMILKFESKPAYESKLEEISTSANETDSDDEMEVEEVDSDERKMTK